MPHAFESDRALRRELEALRRRVAALERDQQVANRVLVGDPERRHAPLLAQVPAVLWVADTRMHLLWWTGGAIEALGVSPAEMIGIDIYAFMGTDDPNHPAIAAHRTALAGQPCSYEAEREGVFFTAHVAPCHDGNGAITGAIGVAIDITERVRAEGRLRQALARVNALSGLIPICMHCKNVRNDAGYWEQVESYVHQHAPATEFTHAICPDCMNSALGERRSDGS